MTKRMHSTDNINEWTGLQLNEGVNSMRLPAVEDIHTLVSE